MHFQEGNLCFFPEKIRSFTPIDFIEGEIPDKGRHIFLKILNCFKKIRKIDDFSKKNLFDPDFEKHFQV